MNTVLVYVYILAYTFERQCNQIQFERHVVTSFLFSNPAAMSAAVWYSLANPAASTSGRRLDLAGRSVGT